MYDPMLGSRLFFSGERDSEPLTHYIQIHTQILSHLERESYSCSYADSRPWLATCYNNVLTINLRFVTSSDILIIYLRELLSRKILYSSSRSAAPGVKKLGLETCCPYKFFQARIYDLQLIVFHFNCDKSTQISSLEFKIGLKGDT